MKKVITAADVSAARNAGQTSLVVPDGAIVTPQAFDDAREFGVVLMRDGAAPASLCASAPPATAGMGRPAAPASSVQARAMQYVQPVLPVYAQPARYVQPAQPAQYMQPVQPAQYAQPAQPAQYMQPVQPAQYAQPAQPAQYAQPTQPVQYAQPVPPALGMGRGTGPRALAGACPRPEVAEEVRRQVLARLGAAAPQALDSVISSVLSGASAPNVPASPSPVGGAASASAGSVVHASAAALASRNAANAPSAVAMAEASPPSASLPGLGYMSWENSSFDWTFQYAEALVVLEGELTLTANGAAVTAVPGDSFLVPAGVAVTLSARGRVRCVHSSWPNPETAKG